MGRVKDYAEYMDEFDAEFEKHFVVDPRMPDEDAEKIQRELKEKRDGKVGTNIRNTVSSSKIKLEDWIKVQGW